MKAFFCIVLAIAAASAEPESDPNLVYTDGTFHTNAANLAKGVHTQYAAGRVGGLYHSVPAAYHGFYPAAAATVGYANPLGYRLYKREAESQPEADPALLINPYTAGYAVRPAVYSAGYTGYPYTTYNAASAYNLYNPYRIYKREAESEPEAEADPALFVNPYAAGYVRPSVYSAGYVSPYANAYAYNTAAYNVYNPYRALYKREAEAEPEADPALLAYSAGYPYATAGYAAYAARPAVYGSVYNRPLTYAANYAAVSPYRYW